MYIVLCNYIVHYIMYNVYYSVYFNIMYVVYYIGILYNYYSFLSFERFTKSYRASHQELHLIFDVADVNFE